MAEEPLTVQLVDGDRARRAARARALARAGWRVVQAGDARRAWAQMRREQPRVVVTRLRLKPFDGAELLRRARGHPLTAQIPFLLLRERREAPPPTLAEPGAGERLLVEPLTPEALAAELEAAIRGSVGAPALPQAWMDLLRLEVHDLKAPLANIIGLCELMLSEQVERPQQEEFLSSIAANAQAMLKLVVNLLNVAALESGRLPLRPEPTPLAELVQAAVQQIAWLVRRKDARVVNEIPLELPPVAADRELLARVFVNLLDNALQHSHPGDEIVARGEREARGVRIDVLDRGPGVPAELRDRIFDEFFRLGPASGISHSTGLGLTFCRLVAEAHGGRIWVSARPGGGSRFSLLLPVRD